MIPDTTPETPASPFTPGAQWEHVASETTGWSSEGLQQLVDYAQTINTDALLICQGGKIAFSYGDTTARFKCHSMRKSFLSALIGIHVQAGTIDLSQTLEELGVDDKEGLSTREKAATIYDLLTARSGVYHPAGYETPGMKIIKEARHSHAPGTWWCYNNWDFNALGTIFRSLTGADIHQDFLDRIAIPIGMGDFRYDEQRKDGHLDFDDCSLHPAYPFRMSSQDLARFGHLFLRGGSWNGSQVLPADWVQESVLPYSDAGPAGAYGYMWWLARDGVGFPEVTLPKGTYSARGTRGHFCMVVPSLDAVIVHRVNTDIAGRAVTPFELGRLLKRLFKAHSLP